jgi:hypothetical protein
LIDVNDVVAVFILREYSLKRNVVQGDEEKGKTTEASSEVNGNGNENENENEKGRITDETGVSVETTSVEKEKVESDPERVDS